MSLRIAPYFFSRDWRRACVGCAVKTSETCCSQSVEYISSGEAPLAEMSFLKERLVDRVDCSTCFFLN